MPAIHLSIRSDDSLGISPTYIAGIAVAGSLVLGLVVWLSIRMYRERARARREAVAGGAFLSIRGLYKETEDSEKSPLPESVLFCDREL